MKIFGKSLSEYVAFSRLFLGLILIVGVTRLAISLAGAPNSTGKWASVTGVVLIGILYYSVRVHTTGFGSYKQLLPVFVLLSLTAQIVSAAAIALAIFTGQDNIFSAPEFSGGVDGKTWGHAGAHLVLATTAVSLAGWLIGSLILFVTRKVAAGGKDKEAAAPATQGQ